jgi:hypothetical protein
MNKVIVLPKYTCGHFSSVHVKSRGTKHALFLNKIPAVSLTVLENSIQVTGYMSYNTVICSSGEYGCGILFNLFKQYAIICPNRICVNTVRLKANDPFDLTFNLEKLGLLLFKTKSGSVVVVKSDISGKMLVNVNAS